MSTASDRWNALPRDIRDQAHGLIIEHQIRDYRIEMERARDAHRRHMADIRSHLKNCERELARWEATQPVNSAE